MRLHRGCACDILELIKTPRVALRWPNTFGREKGRYYLSLTIGRHKFGVSYFIERQETRND